MRAPNCSFEEQVLQGAKDGAWSPQLAAHVSECLDCADLALTGAAFHAIETQPEAVVDMNHARLIWARAEGERLRQRATRALLPVVAAELAACVFGAVALAGLAVKLASPLPEGIGAAGERLLADPVVAPIAPVAAALLLGVALVSLVLAVGFRSVRS